MSARPDDPREWRVRDVKSWLLENESTVEAGVFEKHGVHGCLLLNLELDDMTEMGLSRLLSRGMLDRIGRLRRTCQTIDQQENVKLDRSKIVQADGMSRIMWSKDIRQETFRGAPNYGNAINATLRLLKGRKELNYVERALRRAFVDSLDEKEHEDRGMTEVRGLGKKARIGGKRAKKVKHINKETYKIIESGRRLALLIGNTAYDQKKCGMKTILGPGIDLANIQKVLEDERKLVNAIWACTVLKDLTYDEFMQQVSEWVQSIKEGDDIFIFCASHGLQYEVHHFLVPLIDRPIKTVGDLVTMCIPLQWLLQIVGEMKPRIKVVLIDACSERFVPIYPCPTCKKGETNELPEEDRLAIVKLSEDIAAYNGTVASFETVVMQTADYTLARGDNTRGGAITYAFVSCVDQPLTVGDLAKQIRKAMTNPAFKHGLQLMHCRDTLTWNLDWSFNPWKFIINKLPQKAQNQVPKFKDLASCTKLDLANCSIASQHCEPITEILKKMKVVHGVVLNQNRPGAVLGILPRTLKVLHLRDCNLGTHIEDGKHKDYSVINKLGDLLNARMTELDISYNGLNDDMVQKLVKPISTCTALTLFDMSDDNTACTVGELNDIDTTGELLLKALMNCRGLQVLRLARLPLNTKRSCLYGPNDIKGLQGLELSQSGSVHGGRLAQLSKTCSNIRELVLSNTGVTCGQLCRFLPSWVSTVERLDVSGTKNLKYVASRGFLAKCTKLRELHIEGGGMKREGLLYLMGMNPAKGTGFPKGLRQLWCGGNFFTTEDIFTVIEKYPALELETDGPSGAIIQAVKASKSTGELDLNGRSLTAADCPLLVRLLGQGSSHLRVVNLPNNRIGNDGLAFFLDALATLRIRMDNLETLRMDNWGIGDTAEQTNQPSDSAPTTSIVAKLKTFIANSKLKKMYLHNNHFSTNAQKELQSAWETAGKAKGALNF